MLKYSCKKTKGNSPKELKMKGNFELTLKNGDKKMYRNYANVLNAFIKEYGLYKSYEELDKALNEKIKSYTNKQLLEKYGY